MATAEGSYRAYGADAYSWMDFGLCKHRSAWPDPLDDGAHVAANTTGGQQYRRLARGSCGIERRPQFLHEFLQFRGRHGELAVLGWPRQRFGERRFPLRRQRNKRNIATGTGVAVADLAGQARPYMCHDGRNGAACAATRL